MGKKTINIYLVFLAVFFVFVFFSLLYRVNISKWGYEPSEFEWNFNRHLSLIVACSLIFFIMASIVHSFLILRFTPFILAFAMSVVVILPVLLLYYNVLTNCDVNDHIQRVVKKQLSITEIESIKIKNSILTCPTFYSFRKDSGGYECIMGFPDFFRGSEVSVGGCG